MKNKFLGNTIALILGSLGILGGIGQMGGGKPEGIGILLAGFVTLLGALAYRSLKRRRLGLKPNTSFRQAIEIAMLAVAILAVILQKNLAERIATDPFPNFIIPLWAIVAYMIIYFKKPLEIVSEGGAREATDAP